MATFEQLCLAARWEPDAQGIIDKYRWGLKDNIPCQVSNWDKKPALMDKWEETAWAEVHTVHRTIAAGLVSTTNRDHMTSGHFKSARLHVQTCLAIQTWTVGLCPWRSMLPLLRPRHHSQSWLMKNEFNLGRKANVLDTARRVIWPMNAPDAHPNTCLPHPPVCIPHWLYHSLWSFTRWLGVKHTHSPCNYT